MHGMKPSTAMLRAGVAALVGLACLLVLGGVRPARSQTPTVAQVDKIFAEWAKPWAKPGSPGCALSVIRNGSIAYKRGHGMADLDHNIKIETTTVFHAASLSKQFTAMAIMLLVKQGRLSLDDDVRRHVTELPDLGGRVTIGHLLHHTSGLRDQLDLVTMAGWRLSDDVVTREDVLGLVSRMKALNFKKPGDHHLYSNTGFTLAAEIVERVSGRSLRQFAQANIFQPLGMSRTVFRDTHGLVVRDHAYGYRVVEDQRFEVRMPNYDLVGPTNLLTTVEDLARWERNFDDKTVGGAAVLAQMQTPGTLNNGDSIPYGLGLMLSEYRGLKVVEHDGRDAGYRSHLIRFPDQRFSVACLCNLALPDDALPVELVRRIADIYLAGRLDPLLPSRAPPGNPTLPTGQEVAVTVTPADLAEYAGRYYSEEIDTAYTVSLEGLSLMIKRQKYPDTALKPVSRDDFTMSKLSVVLRFVTVHFTRDAQGRITGFLIGGDRLRNFRFARVRGGD